MLNQYRRNKQKIKELQEYEHGHNFCVKCNSTENLTTDHIIPLSKGGTSCIENLQICCSSCNHKKSCKMGKQTRSRAEVYNALQEMYKSRDNDYKFKADFSPRII